MNKKEDLRIIFMGTPEFAVESLKELIEGGYNVVAVITMPDKPAGRGHKMQFSDVKEYALSKNLPILQPERLKDEAFLQELRSYRADLQIVVAFRMLPEVVWNMPKYGTFNLHASLLPQYRGAAPINWAIINGEKETGATTFFLTHEIDTGKIILQKKTTIDDTDNAGSVHDKLMEMGAKMVTKTVDLLLDDKINAIPQDEFIRNDAELKLAPKIFKETCELKFNLSVEQAHNFVRGLSPYPAAWINIQFPQMDESIILKIFETKPEFSQHKHSVGKLITDGKKEAKIALKNGFLHLLEIQAPGKKKMKIGDFLNGLK
ncbi:Methionyl-tRNA formyltransferase [uncultured Paludibacter sp.]|uniref:Methionyl-tRNA formyltransferase n=1 Tax=uncultured Paludibacter sp. TaxID=497635 RepID=A0A653AFV3_9BACT|nr:Methionyl-tRNA formyltransferase [uncultured Paludibacter sp.]